MSDAAAVTHSVGVVRHFAAIRIYTPSHSYHLNFDRLTVAVALLNHDPEGGFPQAFRTAFPVLSTTEVYDYFRAAQVVVSAGIDLAKL